MTGERKTFRERGRALRWHANAGLVVDVQGVQCSKWSWCLVAVVRDITEQRLARAILAEVEFRLREGEALSHIGSWLWDLRTGAVQWSTEFHRIHGVDPFDFDGTFDSIST